MEARKAELLEVPYFHIVFTLGPRIGAVVFQNKAVISAMSGSAHSAVT